MSFCTLSKADSVLWAFLYADCKRVTVLLSLLFNACVIHGFRPVGLMETNGQDRDLVSSRSPVRSKSHHRGDDYRQMVIVKGGQFKEVNNIWYVVSVGRW